MNSPGDKSEAGKQEINPEGSAQSNLQKHPKRRDYRTKQEWPYFCG